MTFVGRILVIVIMAFSLLFLASSILVFTTQTNWKEEADARAKEVAQLKSSKSDADQAVLKAQGELKAAQDEFDQQKVTLDARITDLETQNQMRQQLLAEETKNLGVAQETMRAAVTEANNRKSETDQLREQLSAVQQQANQFKLRQTELEDEIRILQRQLETAIANNKDLLERNALYSGELRRVGLSDDPQQLKGAAGAVPPEVEGYVKRVDARNQRVELSIGADDGLVPGHELELWRTQPSPDYLGKVRVESTDPDQAVAIVIGKTIQGKKIQEGDIVSSKIRPRG